MELYLPRPDMRKVLRDEFSKAELLKLITLVGAKVPPSSASFEKLVSCATKCVCDAWDTRL